MSTTLPGPAGRRGGPASPPLAVPSLLRFDLVTIVEGRGLRRPAGRSLLARRADRFVEAVGAALPQDGIDLVSAIAALKRAADTRIMRTRRKART